MRAFDNLMHEACHRSLFTNKFWNKWITCLFVAFPVFTSYTAYQKCSSLYWIFKTTLPGFYSVVKDIFTPNYEKGRELEYVATFDTWTIISFRFNFTFRGSKCVCI